MLNVTPLNLLARRLTQMAAVFVLGAIALPLATASVAHAQDLQVTFATAPPGSAIAGDTPTFGSLTTFSFRVNVVNDDLLVSEDAFDPVFEFFVPEHTFVTEISQAGFPGSCLAGTPGDPSNPASCRLGDPFLVPGEARVIDIELHVNADAPELTWLDIDVQACFEDDDASGAPQTSCDDDHYPFDNELHAFTFVNTAADMNISKTHDPGSSPFNAGERLSYESTITNSGPSVVRGLSFTDTLPAGYIFESVDVLDEHGSRVPLGGDLNCAYQNVPANGAPNSSGTVYCELGDLPPGMPIQPQLRVIINGRIDPAFTGAFLGNVSGIISKQTSNHADGDVDDRAPFAGAFSVEDFVSVTDRASIELRKSSTPLNPVAGETFLWTYNIINNGPSDAQNVLFTDTLPQAIAANGDIVYFDYVDDQAHGFCTEISSNPSVISCRPAGSPFTIPAYVLPAGETVEFSVLVRIDPRMPPGRHTNTGEVSVSNSNFSITTFVDDIEVRSVADLKLTKVVSPHNPVRAGENFTYTLIVDNLGPSTAYNIVVTDTLIASGVVDPIGCSLSVTTAGGGITEFNCLDAAGLFTGVFNLSTMGVSLLNPRSPTDLGRATITLRMTADEAMDLTDIATVVSDSEDPNTDNNMAMVAHSVSAVADLSVTKIASAEVQNVNNPGLIPLAPFPPAVGLPNYSLSDTDVTAGRIISYTMRIRNNGPSRAENVVLVDRLPNGITVLDYTVLGIAADNGDCTTGTPGAADDRLTCGLGTLPAMPGVTQRRVRVLALVDPGVPAGAILENDAFVSSDTYEPDNTDNYDTTLTTVNTWADMRITKLSVGENKTDWDEETQRFELTDLPGEVTAGHELRYELTVQNNGPSDAQNVQILDLLPGQTDTGLDHDPVTFLRADGAYCRPADELQEIGVFGPGAGAGKFGQVLWCSLGTVPAGARVTFDVYVQTDPGIPDGTTITNGAYVWWGAASPPARPGGFIGFPFPQIPPALPTTDDPFLDDNFAETDTDINAVADVFVQKVDVPAEGLDAPLEPDLAIAGDEHVYKITFGNHGWSVARNVTLIDTLDFKQAGIAGETFVRCEAVQDGDSVTCAYNAATNEVTVTSFTREGDDILGGVGALFPMTEYMFYLVTQVDPGYVLDADATGTAPNLLAENRVDIASPDDTLRTDNNTDTERTRIIGSADLAVSIVDDAAGFATCDPVSPGNMITYDVTVRNNGPSDAAGVVAHIWIPAELAVDPEVVDVVAGNGRILEVRDDGRVTVAVGNDPNNQGVNEIGRLNADGVELITIGVMVPLSAPCGSSVTARAEVITYAGYSAALLGANEVPAVISPAVGRSWLFLNAQTNELFYHIDVAAIDNITAAHIHRAAAGVNGPVIATLYDGAPPPFGPGDPIYGVVNLSPLDIVTLEAEGFYINVHTSDFPAGEIRGQITREPWPTAPGDVNLGGGVRTPTADPDPTNNVATEDTNIECAKVTVNKTVSYDGTCPGHDVTTTIRQGEDVTFCLEITNTGTTFLDDIIVIDTLSTRSMPDGMVVFTDTIKFGVDPKVPVAPGEVVMRKFTVEKLDCECGIVSNLVEVSATPVNSGRTVLPCITPPTDDDTADIFAPCGGADLRLQLPVLQTEECQTWLQIQNLGNNIGRAVTVIWGEAGACPPQAAGPLKVECTGLLKPGSAWSMSSDMLPAGSQSAVVYSVDALTKVDDGRGNKIPFADLVCGSLFEQIVGDHDEWLRFDLAYRSEAKYFGRINLITGEQTVLDFGAYRGEPLAVSVNRTCPDPVDPARNVSAAYTGISSDMEGAEDKFFGGYTYYAPMLFAEKGGLSSWMWVHNSGTVCTSLEIWFRTQDNCLRPILGDVLSVAPGESVHFDPSTVVGPDWLGSAWIRATQPLGVVIDTMGPNHFSSYRGQAADTSNDWSHGSQVNYAPLIYSEYQGWDTALTVMNMDPVVSAKVKIYFMDRSGDIITTLVDWICPRGSQTFFLPVIAGLPGTWVGSARAESQEWITPGGPLVDPPNIQTVVLLEKWSDPARTERREAVAYNALTEKLDFDWQIAPFTKGGLTSGVGVLAVPLLAKGNRGITSEMAITNVVPKPGFTDFAIYLFDQNGYVDFICEKLGDRQVEYIDLASWGVIPPRFLGSAVISAVYWDHPVHDGRGEFERNLVGLSGVVVERVGGTLGGEDVPGDESKAFEMIPVFHPFGFMGAAGCPGVPVPR